MSAPYYLDGTVTLYHGDSLDVLRTIPDVAVDCAVTSPPYFGLRDYGHAGQIGAEQTPSEYVERLRKLFAEVRRVLANDGTLWLNLGDSYARNPGKGFSGTPNGRNVAAMGYGGGSLGGLPEKNLLGIPWRVAFALQDDGWILRNAVIWSKPNAMPESVTDRLSTRYEMLFMFSKSRRYWFDLDPIREAHSAASGDSGWAKQLRAGTKFAKVKSDPDGHNTTSKAGLGAHQMGSSNLGKNPGDVWNIPTVPFGSGHFAVFPPELPRRCIVAGCKPGGTVLDPFHGSGTTGMVATRNGRKYVGIELNKEYLDLSLRTRLADGVLDFEGGVA